MVSGFLITQQMGLGQGSEASTKRESKNGFLLANQATSDSRVVKGLSVGSQTDQIRILTPLCTGHVNLDIFINRFLSIPFIQNGIIINPLPFPIMLGGLNKINTENSWLVVWHQVVQRCVIIDEYITAIPFNQRLIMYYQYVIQSFSDLGENPCSQCTKHSMTIPDKFLETPP